MKSNISQIKSKKPFKNHDKRLLDPIGKLSDKKLQRISSVLNNLTPTLKDIVIAAFKLSMVYGKVILSQELIAKESGHGRETVNRAFKNLVRDYSDCFGNSDALILYIKDNGFKVAQGIDYESNDIKKNMLSYISTNGFVENLPYLARLSPVCSEIFIYFKKYILRTHLKSSVLRNLGIKQMDKFSHFSVGALEWALNKIKRMISKHIKIKNLEGFVWSTATRYHQQFGELWE